VHILQKLILKITAKIKTINKYSVNVLNFKIHDQHI